MRRFVAVSSLLIALVLASISLQGAPRAPLGKVDLKSAGGVPIAFMAASGALSPAGQDYRQNLHVTWNGNRDSAIITYTTLTGGLWAHHFNGTAYTPGVNIVPADGSTASVIGDRVVTAFINTTDHPNDYAKKRDGDALILFTAVDNDNDGAAAADGKNRALYVAYFDTTYKTWPALEYGFQTTGARISDRDGEEENVICHGVVTDGLIGEARWLNYQYSYKYGDATSGLAMFWSQGENLDGDADIEDMATYAAFFDLGQPGSESLPLVAGPDARLSTLNFGASDSGSTAAQTRVDARYLVYNNVLVLRCAANAAGLGAEPELWNFGSTMNQGDDVTLQAVAFDFGTSTVGEARLLHGAPPDATDTSENNAMPLRQDGSFLSGGHAMYGPDEGLSRLELVFAELVNGQANVSWGTNANNARIGAVEIDPVTGAVLGHAYLDLEDPAINDSVGSTTADCRLSRNGDYMFVGWLENWNEGAFLDKALWTAQILTPRGSTAPPAFIDRVGGGLKVNTEIDDFPVTWFFFEEGLCYVTGAQSNAEVMNIIYEQSCHTDDGIWIGRLTADLDAAPVLPAGSVVLAESFEEGSQPGMGTLNEEHWGCNGTDSGYDGQPIIFYIKDLPAAGTDMGMYAEKGGVSPATCRIDRPSTATDMAMQGVGVAITQAGSLIGPGARTWSSNRVHVMWNEGRSTTGMWAGSGLWTRYWSVGSTASAFADQFTPSAATTPSGTLRPIQLDPEGVLFDITDVQEIHGIARNGNKLGVWLASRGHIWCSEFGPNPFGTSWDVYYTASLGKPTQVDDGGGVSSAGRIYKVPGFVGPATPAKSVGPMKAFFPRPGANSLDRALYLWIQEVSFDGLPLLFARARAKD
ncbi:MAG: hypothetical protein AAB074_07295 [Planctomycetota bacterium]